MYHPFSIAETLRSSWNILKKNLVTLSIYSVISLVIYWLADFFTVLFFADNEDIAGRVVQFSFQIIIQAYLTLSFYKLILTLMDSEYYEFEFKDILPSVKMAMNFILIGLAYGVVIAILIFINLLLKQNEMDLASEIFTILATIGLLYLLLRSIFCVCFIIDDDSTPYESLKQSFHITQDNFFKTLGVVLSIIGIMILTLIPINIIITFINIMGFDDDIVFLLGYYTWFVIAFPAVQVIVMVTYRKLVYSHMDVDDDVAETN